MIFCRKADPQQQLHLFPGNYIFARYIASSHCLDMGLNDQKMRHFLVCVHFQTVLSFSKCAFIFKMCFHFQNVLSFSKCAFIFQMCPLKITIGVLYLLQFWQSRRYIPKNLTSYVNVGLSKWIKVDKMFKMTHRIFFSLSYILASIYFFEYETIVRSSALSLGHSDSDPSSAQRFVLPVPFFCSIFLGLARKVYSAKMFKSVFCTTSVLEKCLQQNSSWSSK
jgi:hypothetical protein